jgi:DNA-directed RNA polymerase specialized sigma subunit
MSPKERQVYNMRVIEEKPVIEIMDKLHVCKNRVWNLISGAKAKQARQDKLIKYLQSR